MTAADLASASAWDVARLAAAAAFGWGLVHALWSAVIGAMSASVVRHAAAHFGRDLPPPPPPAATA